ncbi:MAG: polysaccharide biosynthesis tyrosine autokinase [Pantoea sp.]|uniref:polysaccharide biosynthesis tyrosine autokinase n=1 Tax=Pantoea sp. TaxID=69393 RepID=UPI0039E2AD99
MSSPISKNTATKSSDEFDLSRIIGEIIDHRKIIITITATFTFIAILYSIFATPIYQATAMIQVEQKQGNAILDTLSQVLPDAQPASAPEIALLRSRMILGKTVEDLNLQAVVEQNYFPLFGRGWARLTGQKPGDVEINHLYISDDSSDSPKVSLTVLDKTHYRISGDGFEFDGEVGELLSKNGFSININSMNAKPGTRFTIYYLTELQAINNILDIFDVADQGKDTGMLNLTLNGENKQRVAEILRSISQNYLDQNIAREAAQDAKSLDFLNKQLPQVRSDLDSSEDKLNLYRRNKDSVDLSMEAKTVLDQIVNVDSQLNELTFREAEISQLYTKEHPTYKSLLEKRQTLLLDREKLNKKISAMPATQQEVARLSRDVESGRAIYMQLLNRQQELNVAKSSAIGNVRIIDNAVTEPKPVKPRKMLVILIGIIVGLFGSAACILFKVFLHKGINSPEQLEEVGISVYATVPLSEWLNKFNKSKSKGIKSNARGRKEEPRLLTLENPADLAIEAIRSLRTSLHFAMMDAKNNILMISGASENAGKSFISSNLGVVIAQSGKRVLVIDADMHKGKLHKLFKKDEKKGLSAILSGVITAEDAAETVSSVGIDFISRGKVPPNSSELLMHSRFEELLKWASENYDLVIVDTPPILALTDAAVIGRHVGTTLLVARYEENTVREIEISIRRFELGGVAIKGCILNSVVKKAGGYYSYGYHYAYEYNVK